MPALPPLLVTGFDAFAGDPVNPSETLARSLHGRRLAGRRVVAAVLPTTFAGAMPALEALLDRHRPELVICLGLAGGRTGLSFEHVAINWCDARIPDNAGAQPVDVPVVPDGPAAYFTSLPVKAMREAALSAGVPAEVSHTAGTFVCNRVFYGLMHRLTVDPPLPGCRGGFVHLPWIDGTGTPSLPLAMLERGLRKAIRAALCNASDVQALGGTLH